MLEEFIKYIKSLETTITKLQKDVADLTILTEFNKNKIDQLEKRIQTLEQGEVQIPVNCKSVDWDSSKFVKESIGDKTVYTLGTKNTGNKKVEFKSDFETWTTGKLTFPNTGNCENVWFRVDGCTQEIWGCVTTNPTKVNFITENCK
jgi:ABC-type sulfate/molybdate transport systems ATPase subunit